MTTMNATYRQLSLKTWRRLRKARASAGDAHPISPGEDESQGQADHTGNDEPANCDEPRPAARASKARDLLLEQLGRAGFWRLGHRCRHRPTACLPMR
jgi:hypothetical protein